MGGGAPQFLETTSKAPMDDHLDNRISYILCAYKMLPEWAIRFLQTSVRTPEHSHRDVREISPPVDECCLPCDLLLATRRVYSLRRSIRACVRVTTYNPTQPLRYIEEMAKGRCI